MILSLYFVSLAPAFAQSPEEGPEPTLVRGALAYELSLGIEAIHDSNIFQSATDVQSSPIWRLTPSLFARIEPARSRLELGYEGELARYDKSSDDDYDDHAFEAGAYLLLGNHSGLDLVVSYVDAHENRGAGLSQGTDPESPFFPDSPDRYTTEDLLARYTYGVSRTRAYMTVEGGTRTLEYSNNRTRTQQFDRRNTDGEVTFGVRVRPKTSLELRARTRDINYENARLSGISQDSKENRFLMGVVWEATAKTTGTVLIGRVEKDFKDASRPNFSGPNWEVAIRWSPRSYSHFDFSTERYTEEPVDLLGDVTDTETYSLEWTHGWNDRLESRLAISLEDRTYRFLTGDRKDESPLYSLSVGYAMRPWLRWEAGLDLNERDSDVASYNFDQTIVRLGAWITF